MLKWHQIFNYQEVVRILSGIDIEVGEAIEVGVKIKLVVPSHLGRRIYDEIFPPLQDHICISLPSICDDVVFKMMINS